MSIFLKDPEASLDYAIDWGAGYLGDQTIAGSAWAVEPAGELAIGATVLNGTRTGATLAGGAAGRVYRVANLVTLSDGRSDERALTIRVEDR